jgi:ubiquinone/menaquinone biosynthesis C-methylase UbiE
MNEPSAEKQLADFKDFQRAAWSAGSYADLSLFTQPVAAHLVRFAGIAPGQSVLDVATGTGPVAITAARRGAQVAAIDLTPELLAHARPSADLAGVSVDWKEGDAEALPYRDGSFDAVLSQFGHMFAPRPEVATREMLRVLRPGGTIAFATWSQEQTAGRTMALIGKYAPAPPVGAPPGQWGEVGIIRDRLGSAVTSLRFERGYLSVPALSPAHFRTFFEAKFGPMVKLIGMLEKEPAKLASFRTELEALLAEYLEDNMLRQEYLLTRAVKL